MPRPAPRPPAARRRPETGALGRPSQRAEAPGSAPPLLPDDDDADVDMPVAETPAATSRTAPLGAPRRPDTTAEPKPLDPLLVGQPELSEEFIAVPGKAPKERRPRLQRRERVKKEKTPAVVTETTTVHEHVHEPAGPGGPPGGGRSARERIVLIVLLALLLAALLGGGWYFLLREDDAGLEPIASPIVTVAPTLAPTIAPTPEPTKRPPPPSGLVDRNCDDFSTQQEAQNFYRESGGPTQDLHGLDPDNNGIACEELSTPQPTTAASPQP